MFYILRIQIMRVKYKLKDLFVKLLTVTKERCAKNNSAPELRSLHPSSESSIRFAQLWVRISKSLLFIQGVTSSRCNFLKFGMDNFKPEMEISPKQWHKANTCKFLKVATMFLMILSDISCNQYHFACFNIFKRLLTKEIFPTGGKIKICFAYRDWKKNEK